MKARPFQRVQKILCTINDLDFIVSDVQFGKSLLEKKPASAWVFENQLPKKCARAHA
jgi:hypothetical protein